MYNAEYYKGKNTKIEERYQKELAKYSNIIFKNAGELNDFCNFRNECLMDIQEIKLEEAKSKADSAVPLDEVKIPAPNKKKK